MARLAAHLTSDGGCLSNLHDVMSLLTMWDDNDAYAKLKPACGNSS